MKAARREYVRINGRWHVPDQNGKHTLCDVMSRITEVDAVMLAPEFPKPACRKCLNTGMVSNYKTRNLKSPKTTVDSL